MLVFRKMGRIVDGKWTEDEGELFQDDGFKRLSSLYADEISDEITSAIANEPGRFWMIASLSCPWSHRALIMHRIKALNPMVPVQIASGQRDKGYPVNANRVWQIPGTARNITYVYELYAASDVCYTGCASVPVLWDSINCKVVSNDSLQIMKAFNRVETRIHNGDITLYPEDLRAEIDAINKRIFSGLANGVYRAGLARSQHRYDDAVANVFKTLDLLETRLARGRLMFGRRLTLSDIVLFPVLVRFDIVYHTHFRCTRHRLVDYPMLWAYARDLFSWEPLSADVDFAAIQLGYFQNDGDHNPYGIISERPESNWFASHTRHAFGTPLASLRSGEVCEFEPLTRPDEKKGGSK